MTEPNPVEATSRTRGHVFDWRDEGSPARIRSALRLSSVLGDRTVIDGFGDVPVPYKEIY